MMRDDLVQSLYRNHINPGNISTFQRILLTTDGTITDILEAYLLEQIQLVKLSENLVNLSQDIPPLKLSKGTEVIERKVLLRGKISRMNYIYAESILVLERLDEKLKNELLKTQRPIGKIWLEQRVETYKEIVDSGEETAKDLSMYFRIDPEENLLCRTYCVFSNQKAIMMITEKFPESYFVNNF